MKGSEKKTQDDSENRGEGARGIEQPGWFYCECFDCGRSLVVPAASQGIKMIWCDHHVPSRPMELRFATTQDQPSIFDCRSGRVGAASAVDGRGDPR